MFDEAALTDDLLVQLVEALKKHKESAKNNTETEAAKEKEKEKSEGTLLYMCLVKTVWNSDSSVRAMYNIRDVHFITLKYGNVLQTVLLK